MKKKQEFEIGREYGWLTVLQEAEKDKYSHRQFLVKCRCGKQYKVLSGFLNKKEPKCWECSHAHDMANRRLIRENEDINGWHVYSLVEHYANLYIYECRCLRCNTISYKSLPEIFSSKTNVCAHCKPEYHFQITEQSAEGILPSGVRFKIDASLVETASQYHWRQDNRGYIVSMDNDNKLFLHHLAIGRPDDSKLCVDHISRDKTDCRRENLRVVTLQQNAMNRSMGRNNTSGYVGVSFNKRTGRSFAKISLNDKTIFLGSSYDPVLCAQRYNYAAQVLFRQYAGHRNEVPELCDEEKRIIDQRLKKHLPAAMVATTEVKA